MSPPDDTKLTIGDLLPGLIEYMVVERRFSPATILTYKKNIHRFLRDVGNLPVSEIGLHHVISLKARLARRGVGDAHIGTVVSAVKILFRYARDVRKIPVLDLTAVKPPRGRRREVVYLTREELDQFLQAIPLLTKDGKPRLGGLRFRAIVETLTASAMRISEALALNRDSIDFARGEARVIGRRNRERTVFFPARARHWITRYLEFRTDAGQALFANVDGSRLKPNGVETMFKQVARSAGLEKPVTPQVIRHTTAITLLRNGCPLATVKEILGHANIETTSRIYLGLFNKADIKNAYRAYMTVAVDPAAQNPSGEGASYSGEPRGQLPRMRPRPTDGR